MSIFGSDNVFDRHFINYPPLTITQKTSAASGTYQATTYINKLHELCCKVDVLVERGTGASVTVSTGTLVVAGDRYQFTPMTGVESLGFKTLSGSAFSTTDILTISIREP